MRVAAAGSSLPPPARRRAPVLLASDGNTSALTTYGIGAMLAEKLSLNTRIPSTAIHERPRVSCRRQMARRPAEAYRGSTANPAMPPSATGRRPTASMIAPSCSPPPAAQPRLNTRSRWR